jgi:hypothetical protein
MKRITASSAAFLLACTLIITVRTAEGGPPLICHPIDIGNHRSLPWGAGAFDCDRDYGPDAVVRDTLAILGGDERVLVRMETMRRAGLYLQNDQQHAAALREALERRVLDAEAAGRHEALAWFDAGYFAQTLDQLGVSGQHRTEAKQSAEIDGYAWITRAIELRNDDADLQFAAAMVTALANTPEHAAHVQRARELGAADELLVRNLDHQVNDVWPTFHRRG